MSKKLKVLELFAGYSSQLQALKNIGIEIDEENSFIVEWQTFASIANANLHNKKMFDVLKKAYAREDIYSNEWIDDQLKNYTLSPETKKLPNGNYEILKVDKMKKEDKINLLAALHSRKNLGSVMDLKFKDNNFIVRDLKFPINNDFDLLTYSFPCQDLSLAGKQKGITEGTRSGLLYEVERLLNEGLRPKFLLMENVKNLVGKNHIEDFNIWKKKLEDLGYTNSHFIMNAKDYGVAQNRERVFMISSLEGKVFKQPEKIILEKRLKHYLEDNVDESYYLSDEHIQKILAWKAQEKPLQKVLGGASITPTITTRSGADTSSQKLVVDKLENNKDNFINIEEVLMQERERENLLNSKTLILGINPTSPVYQSDNIIHGENFIISTLRAGNGLQLVVIPVKDFKSYKTWKNNNGEFNTQCNRAVEEDGVALTIAGGGNKILENYIPTRIRKITEREAFRLMGLKDNQIDLILEVIPQKSQRYKLAGNSIVVDVLENIFKEMFSE